MELADLHKLLINKYPNYGYRWLEAILRTQYGIHMNRKTVYGILKVKKSFVHQRQKTPGSRAQGLRSAASRSNERWAMDVNHVPCGRDGWTHQAGLIDCHDRELVGWVIALKGRTRGAAGTSEAACASSHSVWSRSPKVGRLSAVMTA